MMYRLDISGIQSYDSFIQMLHMLHKLKNITFIGIMSIRGYYLTRGKYEFSDGAMLLMSFFVLFILHLFK